MSKVLKTFSLFCVCFCGFFLKDCGVTIKATIMLLFNLSSKIYDCVFQNSPIILSFQDIQLLFEIRQQLRIWLKETFFSCDHCGSKA